MFDNAGQKIKAAAEAFCVIGIILSIILGLIFVKENIFIGFIIIIIGVLSSWVGSIFLYGFGELVDNSAIIIKKLHDINNTEDNMSKRNSTHNSTMSKGNSRTLSSITIPNTEKVIGEFQFLDYSKITSITIPNSVIYIGESAFHGCSSLSSVRFEGTKAQWNAIEKGQRWNYNVPATEVICSDGTVPLN